MLPISPRAKPKSPGIETGVNPKTSIICTKVPEGLFDGATAKKHFSKFGRVQRIRMLPKRQLSIIEYDEPISAERAVLNAGAFDGFMFDVTRSKPRIKKKSKREDDPDWVPDADVEEELSAMSGAPSYRITRQNTMDVEPEGVKPRMMTRVVQQSPVRKKVSPQQSPIRKRVPVEKPPVKAPIGGTESPVLVTTSHTTLSTLEAAAELHMLRSKTSITPDEQWRTLDARDRILRSWGGAGSRVKVGGATIGTCGDMCPEKELLHRMAEHQVMNLETVEGSDGLLDPWRAVKQYSRSSADQEIPMCYELRPASILMRTCSYLLHEIADTKRQVTLADWFHFMWDRFRSIRKDITQQALCCAESIRLVEMCARFHAHCAARLADLEHTQFDQKLNTDNLTKCLQTLKHMYSDVTPEQRPREPEFRGYIALLNLGDANFWWEIKQLPFEIQKSEPIAFAIQVFNALDNNNYVRFFRLVQTRATYLQACILLRYFNDVRARALARIVKAYAPRGGSRFPAADLMSALAFESIENMKSFINHYGLRFGRIEENELSIILSRHQFIEDSDPFPTARAINLIESKRQCSVGEVIAGGTLPNPDYNHHAIYSSFTKDGKLKETALVAEDQGFNTVNDSNKDVKSLKSALQKVGQGEFTYTAENKSAEPKSNLFVKPEFRGMMNPRPKPVIHPAMPLVADKKLFSFKPAIALEPTDVTKHSPEKTFDADPKSTFSFSKPQETAGTNLFSQADPTSVFGSTTKLFENKAPLAPKGIFQSSIAPKANLFENKILSDSKGLFGNKTASIPNTLFNNLEHNVLNNKATSNAKGLFENTSGPQKTFEFGHKGLIENTTGPKSLFENMPTADPKSVFGRTNNEKKDSFQSEQNVFKSANPESVFGKKDVNKSLFGQNVNSKEQGLGNEKKDSFQSAQNVFKSANPESVFGKKDVNKSLFGQNVNSKEQGLGKSMFGNNPETNNNFDSQVTFNSNSIFASAKQNSLFTKPDTAKLDKEKTLFAKPAQETQDAKQPPNIFAAFNKTSESTESKNIFANSDVDSQKRSIFAPNGDVSPGTLFKSVLNPPNGSDSKSYSIFHSKNKAQTVADSIENSVKSSANKAIIDKYEFTQDEEQQQQLEIQLQQQRQKEEMIQQELRKQEELRQQEELRRQEEIRLQEMRRQEELRLQEEAKRREEARRQEEELRRIEEQRRKEERRRQEELKRRLEEERKAELKRLAEEHERKFREAVEKESKQLVEELTIEITNETNREILEDEQEKFKILLKSANDSAEEIIIELTKEICHSEMKAEMFLTFKIMSKWFYLWRQQLHRNLKRRRLLENTPVWLPERTPVEEASYLRRNVEDAALKNMHNFHNGYIFTGELKQLPSPEPYNLMELIKSPLLKRMKQISYPYGKCFFWKVTLVAPADDKWLCRKINLAKWLKEAIGDKKKHEESESLIHVGRQSWNHLMDFAISVCLVDKEKMSNSAESIESTNGILFYFTEKDTNIEDTIQQTLKLKYPYQMLPVAVIMPKTDDATTFTTIQNVLMNCEKHKLISGFKIFLLDPQNINELLNESTKKALRWIAKNYPQTPPLEIDCLKSLCQRYLGNEIWHSLRTERDGRMGDVVKDILKLIRCYNTAVDKLTCVLTNEDLFNYVSFPLEFKPFLDNTSPYPKPYEFIPSNVKTSENISMIRDILSQLKLPEPFTGFNPLSVLGMQQQIRTYCNQIGWFENPEEVVCKVVAVIPNELSDLNMSREDFTQYFAHYDLIDFLNVLVYEKINILNRFDNRFAIYEKTVLHEYRNIHWLYEVDALSQIKHKAIEYEDDLDYFIEAKRRKMGSLEYLMLEDKDCSLVEENIKETDADISKYSDCTKAVKQLEKEIEAGTMKSIEFENMLRAALADV